MKDMEVEWPTDKTSLVNLECAISNVWEKLLVRTNHFIRLAKPGKIIIEDTPSFLRFSFVRTNISREGFVS